MSMVFHDRRKRRKQDAGRMSSPAVKALPVIALAIFAFCLVRFLPLPEAFSSIRGAVLEPRGRISLAVLAFALVLWIAETLPFHVTGLAAVLLLAVTGGGDFAGIVKSGFGDETIVFFIGVLVLASALGKSGLARRFSRFVLSLTGTSTRAIIFGFMTAGAFMSMWITALASSAMLMPLALGILEEEGEKPGESRFGRALMIAVAWGALLGALGTPAGSGSNPIAIRFLAEIAGWSISFPEWMAFGIPGLLLLLPLAWLILILFFPPEHPHLRHPGKDGNCEPFARSPSMDRDRPREPFAKNPLTRQEKAVSLVFCATVLVWILSPWLGRILGFKISISMGALMAVVLLFLPGSAGFSWKELQKDIDWASILLIATGICLGMNLYSSGAAAWVSAAILGGIGSLPPFWQLVTVPLGVFIIKIVFSSNTLTGTIIVPLVLSLGATLGMDARLLALAAAFASNLAFILVTTSPVNVIPYSTGYFTIRDMAKSGLVLAVAAAFVIALVFSLLGPALVPGAG